jgi:hypothetical protein
MASDRAEGGDARRMSRVVPRQQGHERSELPPDMTPESDTTLETRAKRWL